MSLWRDTEDEPSSSGVFALQHVWPYRDPAQREWVARHAPKLSTRYAWTSTESISIVGLDENDDEYADPTAAAGGDADLFDLNTVDYTTLSPAKLRVLAQCTLQFSFFSDLN